MMEPGVVIAWSLGSLDYVSESMSLESASTECVAM